VDALVAFLANHEGFAPAFCHLANPRTRVRSAWSLEVCELPDVVDLQPCRCLAHLTASGKEPTNQLVLPIPHDRLDVGHNGGVLPPQRDSAEAGDQWLPAVLALHHDCEAPSRSVRSIDGRLVLARHLVDGGVVFRSQGPE
jgi:hypothetical protein